MAQTTLGGLQTQNWRIFPGGSKKTFFKESKAWNKNIPEIQGIGGFPDGVQTLYKISATIRNKWSLNVICWGSCYFKH